MNGLGLGYKNKQLSLQLFIRFDLLINENSWICVLKDAEGGQIWSEASG